MRKLLVAATLCLTGTQAFAQAQETPFDQGKVNVSGGLGLQSVAGDTFVVASLGLGYYVLKGLEVSMSTAAWVGHEPFIATLTPATKYVFWQAPLLHPYVGGFYRYWYIGGGMDDAQSVGGRVGVTSVQRPVLLQAGIVVETMLTECEGDDCTTYYPELSLAFSF